MRALIVEDDSLLAEGLSRTFHQLGFEPLVLGDGLQASEHIDKERFSIAVLDIGLPGLDGLALLRQLRALDAQIPVIVLTARDSVGERIHGLDLGADDYLIKPIVLTELAARIRAMIRRANLEKSVALNHGPLRMDTLARRAWMGDEALDLTAREWQMLEFFLRRPERVVSKDQIHSVIGVEGDPNYNAVEVYVSRLRAKIEASGVRIRTVRGFGYMLEDFSPGESQK